jgi:galactokinase/mevalonate kinase-like predicted kinase
MKHKGIICFVYQKEKEEIIQSIKDNLHIIFSENFDDSEKIKPEQYYIVVSLKMADKNLNKFNQMLLNFSDNDYPILHDNNGKFSNKVLDVFWETKIPYHNYTTASIIENIKILIAGK